MWKHIGHLHSISRGICIEPDRYYCLPCLDVQKAAKDKGHLSNVKSFSFSTSTGTMSLHLSVKHNISDVTEDKVQKIVGYLQKYDKTACMGSSSLTEHEIFRDLTIWFCRDLLPFDTVGKEGMQSFFQKVLPAITLPTPATISSTALNDVYLGIHEKVKLLLQDVRSLCLMFDGWTDRHKGRPYLGIRASFIKNWAYHVVTLGCHVVPVHTSREIADHVLEVLGDFIPDTKRVLLSTCHDGAANMVNSLHLLLS